jgi:hypothetical protein
MMDSGQLGGQRCLPIVLLREKYGDTGEDTSRRKYGITKQCGERQLGRVSNISQLMGRQGTSVTDWYTGSNSNQNR